MTGSIIRVGLLLLLGTSFAGCSRIEAQPVPTPTSSPATVATTAAGPAAPGLDFRFVRPDAVAACWFNLEEVDKNKSIRAWAEKNYLPQAFGLTLRDRAFPVWQKVTQAYYLPPDLSPTARPSHELLLGFTAPDAQTMQQAVAKDEEERTKSFRMSDRQAPECKKFRVPELEQELSGIERGPDGKLPENWRTQQLVMEYDSRTMLIAGRGALLLDTLKPATPVIPAGWNKLLAIQNLSQSTLVGVLDLTAYRKLNPMQRLNLINWRGYSSEVYSGLHLLNDKLDQLVIGVNLRDGLQLTAISSSADEAQAAALKQLLDSEIAKIRMALPSFLQLLAQVPAQDKTLSLQLVKEVEQGFNSIQVVQKGNLVRLTVQFRQQTFDMLVTLQEQMKQQTELAKNLRQISLAMLQHENATKRFPASSSSKPDAPQNAASWRVLLLPYLGEQELFKQYNLNKPWDSEQNKKLLDKMPAVYRSLNATNAATCSSYYVIVHPGAIFDVPKDKLPRFTAMRQIYDGTSNTLMIVEANTDIPWTKPEDLVLADPPTVPALGFEKSDTFQAAMADGVVRQFPKNISPELFLKLLLRGDGAAPQVDWKSLYPEFATSGYAYPTLGWRIPRGPDTATKAGPSKKSESSSSTKDRAASTKDNPNASQTQQVEEAQQRAQEMLKKIQEESNKSNAPVQKATP